MTTAGHDPDGHDDADDTDARFADIVARMSGEMVWDTSSPDVDRHVRSGVGTAAGVGNSGGSPDELSADDGSEDQRADERRRRREQRRAERAQEVAEFEADREAVTAELEADDAHFVPPDPPPLPRLRRRTVSALVLMTVGVMMLARPSWFQIAPDAVLILGLIIAVAGAGLLVAGLRAGHLGDGTDFDDGARV